jgi:cysteine desulfurase
VRRLYLDNAATTPLDQRVLDAMLPYLTVAFGNASSLHAEGRAAFDAIEHARSIIASAVGATAAEVFFTSGGTESDNLALIGAFRVCQKKGRARVIVGSAEHHAVLDTAEWLKVQGADVVVAPVDGDGVVQSSVVAGLMTDATAIVSVMHANNEVGSVNPVRAIAGEARRAGALMHCDAVQSFCKIPVTMSDLGVDLLSLSSHKIRGPKGAGALVVRRGVEIEPMLHGGGQERGQRPGTQNVANAVGFGRAVELALAEMDSERIRLRLLRDALRDAIAERYPFCRINGSGIHALPGILNISIDPSKAAVEGEMLVPALDLEGVAVSSGSACTSGSVQPSHVLLAMGLSAKESASAIRFSFGAVNSHEDVLEVLQRLDRVFARMIR